MKNFEVYENEIKKHIDDCSLVAYLQNRFNVNDSVYEILRVLYEEFEFFTEEEKIILKNINEKFKYIARDSDGTLWLFEFAPKKSKSVYFNSMGAFYYLTMYEHLFKSVTFDCGAINFREAINNEKIL